MLGNTMFCALGSSSSKCRSPSMRKVAEYSNRSLIVNGPQDVYEYCDVMRVTIKNQENANVGIREMNG